MAISQKTIDKLANTLPNVVKNLRTSRSKFVKKIAKIDANLAKLGFPIVAESVTDAVQKIVSAVKAKPAKTKSIKGNKARKIAQDERKRQNAEAKKVKGNENKSRKELDDFRRLKIKPIMDRDNVEFDKALETYIAKK